MPISISALIGAAIGGPGMSLLKFHQLAAARGDGLRPELRALFERLASGDVCEGIVYPDGMIQAGPSPADTDGAPTRTIGVVGAPGPGGTVPSQA
jgi:hypothetical protein